MTAHLGYPIPSPAILEKIGTAFRRAVDRVRRRQPHPGGAVRQGRPQDRCDAAVSGRGRPRPAGRGWPRSGWRRSSRRCSPATKKNGSTRAVWFSFTKADRRVTCYYFYVWDDDFGPAFVKVCAYFPYPMKIWVNGHEWAKRQATKAGIGFTELSNGFATCRRSRWAAGDLRPARPGRDPGVRRTLVVDPAAAAHRARPRRRLLVGAVDAPGRDLAHPGVRRTPPGPRVLRGPGHRQPRHRPPGTDRADLQTRPAPRPPGAGGEFKTKIVTYGTEVNVNAFYRHSRIKQYLKDGRALRIETVINDPDDLGCLRRLHHLDELQARARAVNTALLDTERVGQGCVLASPAFERIAQPTLTEDGRRAPALRFGDPRVQALAGALCTSVLAVTGITNKSLRALMTGLLGGANYTMNQASYDLARLRVNGLITRIPGKNRYRLTGDGLRFAIFYTKLHDRLLTPLLAADQPPAPTTIAKGIAHHRHSHHRNHRPGPTPTERSLKTQDNSQRSSDQGSLDGPFGGAQDQSGDLVCCLPGRSLESVRVDAEVDAVEA